MIVFIPSNIIDIYSRLEVLFGLNLFGHTDTSREVSNLIDELYKRIEIQVEQQYRNAPDKLHSKEKEIPKKLQEQIAFNSNFEIGSIS